MHRKGWIALMVVALAVFATGCRAEGDIEIDPQETASPTDDEDVDVDVDVDGDGADTLVALDNEFNPEDFTTAAGGSFELRNDGDAMHNLTIPEADVDRDVAPGDSETISVPTLEPGTYEFSCEYHVGQGMTGTLTLE